MTELKNLSKHQKRIKNFKEFTIAPNNVNFRNKGKVWIAVPFCRSGCPLGNLIPDFNDAVHKMNGKSANILHSTNNFPNLQVDSPRSL